MSAKKLIPFIIILVVLAGVAFLQKGKDTSTPITEQFTRLAPEGLEADSLDRLELYAGAVAEGEEPEKVVLAKVDDAWRVTSQFNAPAKAETVTEYLEKLVGLKGEYRAKAGSDEELASWQLKDDEAFHVAAYEGDAEEPAVHVLVGKAPGSRSVFLRQEGAMEVFQEATNLRRDAGVYEDGVEAKPEPDHWLDKDVLKLDQAQVTGVSLTYPDKALAWEQREVPQETPEPEATEDGEEAAPTPPPAPVYEWALASGGLDGETAKETATTNILTKLAGLTATDVADPDTPAEWGLEAPAFRCEATLKEGDAVVLEAGRPDPAGDAYVRVASADPPVVYQVSSWNFEQLFPQGEDLYTLPKPAITTDEVAAVEVARPGSSLRFEKVDGNWTVTDPALGLDAQVTTLSGMATTLGTWKPEDYAAADADTGSFDTTLTVTSTGGATHTIALGGPAKSVDGRYVKIDGGAQVYTMKDTDVQKLLFEPRDAFQLSLFDFNEADVVRVDVAKGEETVTLTQQTDGWTFTDAAATSPADVAKCDDLLASLVEMQAADIRWEMPALPGAPEGSLTVYFKSGDPLQLSFGQDGEGQALMAVAGKARVFDIYGADRDRFLGDLTAYKQAAPAPEAPPAPAEAAAPVEAAPEAAPEVAPAPEAVPEAAPAQELSVELPGAADAAPAVTIPAPGSNAPEAPVITVQPAPEAEGQS